MNQGGAATPVWLVPDEELLRNGGSIPIQGGPAVPITNPPANWLISSDANNLLSEGSDGRLFVSEGYTVYIAKISQTGTSAPVVTVLENTIGNLVWTRATTGSYAGTLVGAFPVSGKVVSRINNNRTGSVPQFQVSVTRFNSDIIIVQSKNLDTGTVLPVQSDDVLVDAFVEIRVYP